jgi:hypothetical protein
VASPPLPGSSKLTSVESDDVIWTKFSGNAPSRVDSPSKPRVRRLLGWLQALALAPAFMKNLDAKLTSPTERVANFGATPAEWQASNMDTNLSALSLSFLVMAAISLLVMT